MLAPILRKWARTFERLTGVDRLLSSAEGGGKLAEETGLGHRALVLGARAAALVSFLAALGGPTSAGADPAVQFVEETPVAFTVDENGVKPSTVSVPVVITGGPNATVIVEVIGEAEEWVSLDPGGHTAPSNGRVEFHLIIAGDAQPAQGVLVATTSEGALGPSAAHDLNIRSCGRAPAIHPSPSMVGIGFLSFISTLASKRRTIPPLRAIPMAQLAWCPRGTVIPPMWS